MKHLNTLLLLGCCGLMASCGGATDETDRVSLTAQIALDSGNVAYRRGDYKAATNYFRQAARDEPQMVAGWYGVYMAESKLGNLAAADSARGTVARIAPQMPAGEHPTAKSMAPPNPHTKGQPIDPHAKEKTNE